VNRELALKVADAVLYEGYMLYPYRTSALKNRQRWSFGILYPPAYAEVQSGTERSQMHTECLLRAATDASLLVELRFLDLMARQIYRSIANDREAGPSLSVDGQLDERWDEGVARTTEFEVAIAAAPQIFEFTFPASATTNLLNDAQGNTAGSIERIQKELRGTISVSSKKIRGKLWKLSIDVSNETEFHGDPRDRDASLQHSLLSAHTILTAKGGEFASLLDPPESLQQESRSCVNVGNFPVLIGNEDERDMLLCSPIILYDYPQVAPESSGDFYDATEIDEMLTLRVMTLSEEEKNEMRRADDRTRAVLERTEQTAREQLARTHGIMRNPTPPEQGSSEQRR
jgi:hypothetical protein